MARLYAITVIVAVAVLLGGCGSEDHGNQPTPPVEDSIRRIEADPNMPPEAKAAAKAQIEAMNQQAAQMNQSGARGSR